MLNLLLLAISLFIVIKSADFAVKYSHQLAPLLRLPKYTIGFLIVALISILPETFISITSALNGIPEFGLGTLFGSNVADLTLIFTIIVLTTNKEIKVNSKILNNNKWFPALLAIPIIFGWDGHYTRSEGLVLIMAGLFFYYWVFRQNRYQVEPSPDNKQDKVYTHLFFLLISVGFLIAGSNLTVKYGVAFAQNLNISPILIAMFIVGLGTTLPELFFSLRAKQKKQDELALGDILGTVVSDATIVVGIIALIKPFDFPARIIYVTAVFMLLAGLLLLKFLRTDKALSKKEAYLLLSFYLLFVLTEYLINYLN